MSMELFNKKLKEARIQKGLSQRGLGLALGLSDKTISSYESNRSFPNLEILEKISEILDKPIEYFISSSKKTSIIELLKQIEKNQEEITKEIISIREFINREE